MNYGYIRETGEDLFVILRNVDFPWEGEAQCHRQWRRGGRR
jgi:hypothetical protein